MEKIITILKRNWTYVAGAASGSVTGGHTRAVKLAQTLLRNLVFPDNLSEILDDYNLPDETVPKVET